MIRVILIMLFALSLILSSCESRRSRIDRKNLIPENELVSILKDIYITDGLLGIPRIVIKYPLADSVAAYTNIIEKHGYTKEAMDRTLKYYFIKNPKKLIKIYDKVLGILSEMESRIQKEVARSKAKTGNFWPGFDAYLFPDPSGTDSTVFNISFRQPGFYVLNASVTLFPDDQTLNPGLKAFTCHADSIETGKRKYIKPVYYLKDGREHKYSVTFNVPTKTILYATGSLYDFDNNPDEWGKHLIIKNISVNYSLVEP